MNIIPGPHKILRDKNIIPQTPLHHSSASLRNAIDWLSDDRNNYKVKIQNMVWFKLWIRWVKTSMYQVLMTQTIYSYDDENSTYVFDYDSD